VLRTILDHGPTARSTIAQTTGLSAATITAHAGELIRRGLVRELAETKAHGLGRPHVPLDLDRLSGVVGGIHFGVQEATVALVDLRGEVVAEYAWAYDDAARPESTVQQAGEALRRLWQEHRAPQPPLAIGVATGGWVDPASGLVADHRILGWRDVAATADLQDQLGLPVAVDAHARALARAEQLFGDLRARDSVLVLHVGNVVDAAFAVGDTVQRGPQSRAGAIAHLPLPDSRVPCACGRTGCFQATVAQPRLLERAMQAGSIDRPSLSDLLTAASSGDHAAVTLLRERAAHIGWVAALLADLLNPEVTVVAEIGVLRLASCRTALRTAFAGGSSSGRDAVEAVIATSFDSPLASAAGAVALDQIYRNPLAVPPLRSIPT
jgi:predicted NBD/HSP70 family sugar kinase